MSNVTRIVAIVLVVLACLLGVFAVMLASRPTMPPSVPEQTYESPRAIVVPETVPVVVAARPIAAGQYLELADLQVMQWPTAPGGGFGDATLVQGKIARFDMAANEAVTTQTLASGFALRIAEGERAVAIAVDEISGSGNRVQPGDFVDVFFTLERMGSDVERNQARLLLPRVKVLAYGQDSVDGPPPGQPAAQAGQPGQPARSTQPAPQARSAVLAVPLVWVNELLVAGNNGKLRLALRNPEDSKAPDMALFAEPGPVLAARTGLSADARERLLIPENRAFAGIDLPGLAGGGVKPPAAPAPVVRAASPRTPAGGSRSGASIEVVRGTSTETVSY